ncbi:UDP-glucuronosyltransferase 2C1-like isoform X2 [Acanthaster planci]|uniref:UDP-glucuronosyltransferase 2C1-like isoform X2 n=1 Tax=Acanthaster planci TaxID=133434 RepID=A0A8B7ZV04_ACAPL|nr:UDP-glucuronosyltransferase 2C1-like isoform X2 [Acanthaster planci]
MRVENRYYVNVQADSVKELGAYRDFMINHNCRSEVIMGSFWRCLLMVLGFCVFTMRVCQSEDNVSRSRFKFLIYTSADDGSHHMQLASIAKSLVGSGHSVTFLLSSSCTKWLHADDAHLFHFIVYRSLYTQEDRREISRRFSISVMNGDLRSLLGIIKLTLRGLRDPRQRMLLEFPINECDALLGDDDAARRMEAERFDLLIGDDLTFCIPLLAEKLGIGFVLYSASPMKPAKLGLLYGVPSQSTYIPERQLGLSSDMTLPQRVANTAMSYLYTVLFYEQACHYSPLQRKYGIGPAASVVELIGRAELWIFSMNLVLDYPRPLQPNLILIAVPTIGVQADLKVPPDQQVFVNSADQEGVVLFSLGTHMNEMPAAQADVFARGLAKISQKVLWHFTGNTSHLALGNNTKVVPWIPMRHFMEHPNVKAILCHGGSGIVQEAAWFGLPIVGVPLFGDHFDNLIRAVDKGFAVSLDLFLLTEDNLQQAVQKVINEPTFRENAKKLSEILRDEVQLPADKAAGWITHVARFGGKHLRPRVLDQGLVERYQLDVYAVLLLGGAVTLAIGWLACRCCFRALRYRCGEWGQARKVKLN